MQAITVIHDQFVFAMSTNRQILGIPLLRDEALFTFKFHKAA